MGDSSRKSVLEEVIAYSDDIIEYLKDQKDANILTQHLEHSKVLQSQCLADSNDVHSLLQGLIIALEKCKGFMFNLFSQITKCIYAPKQGWKYL
ncbi:hypothetical protein Acr_03g0005830 [Actinidia rufa]|uniref:Uncharacterized protein n=1 Tax=Actinidia rufa TaxID=165716 RepID=A0A7J0ED70_9ERIC|nr:hypothetical protein Acr_03g0005830 [Actinidia rufa]